MAHFEKVGILFRPKWIEVRPTLTAARAAATKLQGKFAKLDELLSRDLIPIYCPPPKLEDLP